MQIQRLAQQIEPIIWKKVVGAYEDATTSSYGYLLFDFHSQTDNRFRIRTKLFKETKNEEIFAPTVYLPKVNVKNSIKNIRIQIWFKV